MARSTLLVGAKLFMFVNGRPYGRVSDFRYTIDTPTREVAGIDSMLPFEEARTICRVRGSMTIYRLSGDGAAEGAGLVAPVSELSREKYVTLMLMERGTNKVVFETNAATVESQDWSLPARGYVMGSVSFKAIGYNNELREFASS